MASKLVDLLNQIAKETDFISASTLERERNNIVNLSGEAGRYFVALFNNTPVGVCLCYFDDTTGENLVHISLLAVLKKHSGKGVATSLIGKASVKLKNSPLKRIANFYGYTWMAITPLQKVRNENGFVNKKKYSPGSSWAI